MKIYQNSNFGGQLGKAVKKLRDMRQMSQEELTQKAGFSTGYISKLEDGKFLSPSIIQILNIAKGLGMTLRDLLEYTGLIPRESTFESCLRGEGLTEEQINKIIDIKNYELFSNKNDKKS